MPPATPAWQCPVQYIPTNHSGNQPRPYEPPDLALIRMSNHKPPAYFAPEALHAA